MTKSKITCEDVSIMLMGLIDGELDQEQKGIVEDHIKTCEKCTSQYESFLNLKKGTSEMKLKKLPEMYWDDYWEHVYNKIERGVAWIFVSIGVIVLLAYGGYQMTHDFFFDPAKPLVLRIGTGVFSLGLLFLFVSVLREKLMIRGIDKYRSIKR